MVWAYGDAFFGPQGLNLAAVTRRRVLHRRATDLGRATPREQDAREAFRRHARRQGTRTRERATNARDADATRVIAGGAIGRVILDDDGVGRGANAAKRGANARWSFVSSRARVAARARASTGERRAGRGDGDRAGRILEGFGARARGADESCVRRGVDGDAFDESGRLTDD